MQLQLPECFASTLLALGYFAEHFGNHDAIERHRANGVLMMLLSYRDQ